MNPNLSVLLIDDEVNILNNIQQVIPWGKMGIDIIGLAKNGLEALSYMSEYQPDLILCDIRMPVMDGIQFIQELRKVNEECEVILLTGYQDFEYARAAIRYRARDYILKPINYDELEALISLVAFQIRTFKARKFNELHKWNQVVKIAYEKWLFDILMGYAATVEPSYILPGDLVQWDQLKFNLILVDIEEYSHKSRFWNAQDRKLWHFAVKNVLQEALQIYDLSYAVIQMREGEFCVVIERPIGSIDPATEAYEWAEQLKDAVERYVKLKMHVGLFSQPSTISELADVYKKVQREFYLSPGTSDVLLVGPDVTVPGDPELNLWYMVEEIVSGMKQNDRNLAENALKRFNANLQAISVQSLERVEKILHFLVLHLLREMKEIQWITSVDEETIWDQLEYSVGIKDLLQVTNWMVEHGLKVVNNLKSSDLMAVSAKDYIQRNLTRDLSVDELSSYLGISCSYFSLLFKQHFRITFVEYLTQERMEMAKTMLTKSDKSINKIAGLVGYSERRYFSKVFQKYTGMAPSEYREKRPFEERG